MLKLRKPELIELYINQELSTIKIARKYGVTRHTIRNWLIGFNIPRRNNGGSRKGKPAPQNAGRNHGMYGRQHTKKSREKMSKSQRLRFQVEKIWNKGETKETSEGLRKQSESLKGKPQPWNSGSNHHNWHGGKSFEPYTPEFNEDIKLIVRFRDNFTCQLCPMIENGRALDVHHIDYDKKNNSLDNLITLCISCHQETNFNRQGWINIFSELNSIRVVK